MNSFIHNQFVRSFAMLAFFALINPKVASAEAPRICASILRSVEVGSSVGSANTWGNLRNHDGSLRAETSKLLDMADKAANGVTPPEDLCPDHCDSPTQAEIVFTSIPSKFLSSYSDKTKCEEHLLQTSKEPLAYLGKSFDNMSALNDWYGDFSQGKGRDGKDLYQRCDGDCSPQYRSVIKRQNGKYLLDAFVVCGHARDKNDNNYDLKVKFSWNCLGKE